MTGFTGFPKEFFGFFRELKDNNERGWFNDNKDRYRAEVVGPMSGFIAAIAPGLEKVSTRYVADPRPNGGSMFRIYRDVRFSKDKRPYKEHAACQFRHESGRDAHAPGFYVHFAPDEVLYGGGIWKPPGPALEKIRQAIAGDPKAWRKAATDKTLVKCFGEISGDGLKRPPRGFDPDDPNIEDLKRKTFFVMRRVPPGDAESPGFVDDVAGAFRAAKPLMRFLCKSLDKPF